MRALEIREGLTLALNLIMVSPHYFKEKIRAPMNLINPQQTGYGARDHHCEGKGIMTLDQQSFADSGQMRRGEGQGRKLRRNLACAFVMLWNMIINEMAGLIMMAICIIAEKPFNCSDVLLEWKLWKVVTALKHTHVWMSK